MNIFAFLEKQLDSVMDEMRESAKQSKCSIERGFAAFYHVSYHGLKLVYQLCKIAAVIISVMCLMNISQTLQHKLNFDIFVYEQAQAGMKGA